jgi:hypothetical protein
MAHYVAELMHPKARGFGADSFLLSVRRYDGPGFDRLGKSWMMQIRFRHSGPQQKTWHPGYAGHFTDMRNAKTKEEATEIADTFIAQVKENKNDPILRVYFDAKSKRSSW